jgi:protein-arginine kinase activator protein McsA
MNIKKTIKNSLLVLLLIGSAGLYSQDSGQLWGDSGNGKPQQQQQQKQKYYCKYCGMEYSSVRDLTANWCQNNPLGKNGHKHELYEGTIKAQYTCKFCGMIYKDLLNLTRNICQRNPAGKGKCHEPAL